MRLRYFTQLHLVKSSDENLGEKDLFLIIDLPSICHIYQRITSLDKILDHWTTILKSQPETEPCSVPHQTSKMKRFAKIANTFNR